jgi:tetratricopeptide (TPR) repeat protein
MTVSSSSEQTWLSHMKTGQHNFQHGKFSDAVQAFTAATELLPVRVEGWINLGSALFESKRYDLAADALQRAVSMNPALMVTHLLLGDALRMLGHWRQASACYHNAVALQRVPLSLNKLACAMRVEKQPGLAEALYSEAIAMEPGFTLGRVNLATLQIELHRYDMAKAQLDELAQLPLPRVEGREVAFAQMAVAEHDRLNDAIAKLVEHNEPALLEYALRQTPAPTIHVDKELLASLQRYADSAQRLTHESVTIDHTLPEEWPLIEAMFMMPLVNTVQEYQAIKTKLKKAEEPSIELLESINMEGAIKAARGCQFDMLDPVKAELHLRHWHTLACNTLTGFQPGHFKYTQNWVPTHPTVQRVEPALASATFRQFISESYRMLPAGYARAALVYIALLDLHNFADGNARVAFTWLNRELEWAGLIPAILPYNWGLNGALGNILSEVRSTGDVSPMIDVIRRGQSYAREFCGALEE